MFQVAIKFNKISTKTKFDGTNFAVVKKEEKLLWNHQKSFFICDLLDWRKLVKDFFFCCSARVFFFWKKCKFCIFSLNWFWICEVGSDADVGDAECDRMRQDLSKVKDVDVNKDVRMWKDQSSWRSLLSRHHFPQALCQPRACEL